MVKMYTLDELKRWTATTMETIGVSVKTVKTVKLVTKERGSIPIGELTRFMAEVNAMEPHPNNKISWGFIGDDTLYLYYEEEQ
jgi:hypothetical protein